MLPFCKTSRGVSESPVNVQLMSTFVFVSALSRSHFIFRLLGSAGEVYLLTPSFATECGYTVSQDPFGNVLVRASVMACMVVNEVSAYTVAEGQGRGRPD